jgi:hypothetical protein
MKDDIMVKVNDYFNVVYGTNLELSEIELDDNGINFVSRTEKNNGVSAKVRKILNVNPNPSNTISVSCGGSVMESFLQKEEYYSGRDLYYLKPKLDLNDKQLLYYCMCLKSNRFRFNYGRQANKTLSQLYIPEIKEIPVWVENKTIPQKPTKEPIIKKEYKLNINNWKTFYFKDLFEIKKGKRLTIEDQISGNVPYVSSSSFNNGIDNYIGNGYTDTNCMTFACYGSIGEVFYQNDKVWVSDNANVFYLRNKKLNPYIGMFLTTILRLEQFRFSYGMTGKKERLQNFLIKLPIDQDGNPDWNFMENYIKSLPYSGNL